MSGNNLHEFDRERADKHTRALGSDDVSPQGQADRPDAPRTGTGERVSHTAGPWIVEPIPPDAHTDPDIHIDEDCGFWVADARANGDVIALVQITPREPREAEANGRLIAAAPDLLAVAQRIVDLGRRLLSGELQPVVPPRYQGSFLLAELINDAHAAIAKAEGAA